VLEERTGQIQEVGISGGKVREFNWDGVEVPLQFQVTTAKQLGSFGGDKELVSLLHEGHLQAEGLLVDKGILRGVILASRPMTAQQLPQKETDRTPRIEVRIAGAANAGVPVGSSGPIVIHGRNFETSGAPVEVVLDGRPVQGEKKMQVDKRGEFTTSINLPLNVGGHTILVRQKTEHGVIQDAYTYDQ